MCGGYHALPEDPHRDRCDRSPRRKGQAEAKAMMRPDHFILVQITLLAGAAAIVGELGLKVARYFFGG